MLPTAEATVASSASTSPGAAADWSREAVFTMSPATIAWFPAPTVTAASPVTTPARAARSCPMLSTPRTTSSAARTARWASSSWATGVPQTAMTASPMNFSTVPPWWTIDDAARSKYPCCSSRTCSGSRPDANAVKPTRSTKSTVTRRRSAARPSAAAEAESRGD
jgi:hypothetical protein